MLVKRHFEREGENIKMFSTYDHSDVMRQNYLSRMSGDKGYVDQGKDFMKVASIPIAFIASLTNEQKMELDNEPRALIKLLAEHPEWRSNTVRL